MKRFDLLLEGIEHQRHLEVDWILSMTTLSKYPFNDELRTWKPYDIAIDRDTGKRVFFDPVDESATWTRIEHVGELAPIIHYKEKFTVKPGDLPNIKESFETLGGNFLLNLYLLALPFGDKVPYVNKKMTAGDFNDPVAAALASDAISIEEFLRFCEMADFINNFWGVSTPTGSEKTMLVSPNVMALKDKLLKEHAGELDNAVVVTGIEKQLIAQDAEDFKGDVAEDFFVSSKSRAVSRKKARIMYGLDDGLGGKPSMNTKALAEGLTTDNLAIAADSTRAASYSRGFLTAQGGELVNYLYRVFMNTKITRDDCGTKEGVAVQITTVNMKRYLGRYMFDGAGKTALIGLDNIKTLVGKNIIVRTPGRCKEKAPNFCAHCTDEFFFKSRETVHIETSLPGSVIMNDRMKAMHGREFKISMFEPTTQLT